MKNPVFILTEHRQTNGKERIDRAIQQAITAWLTKELTK